MKITVYIVEATNVEKIGNEEFIGVFLNKEDAEKSYEKWLDWARDGMRSRERDSRTVDIEPYEVEIPESLIRSITKEYVDDMMLQKYLKSELYQTHVEEFVRSVIEENTS